MGIFPNSHVCPLAVERNKARCADPASKPDAACNICRAELIGELGDVMLEGDASLFEMLFVGHVLEHEGFVGAYDESGRIQLERVQGKLRERPGDCVIGVMSPAIVEGFWFFIAIDDDREISEVFDTLDDAVDSYFDHKGIIEKLSKDGRAEG